MVNNLIILDNISVHIKQIRLFPNNSEQIQNNNEPPLTGKTNHLFFERK